MGGTYVLTVVSCRVVCVCCGGAEQKVVFHSRQRSVLINVIESILSLCYPFVWPHIYIPLLPKVSLR